MKKNPKYKIIKTSCSIFVFITLLCIKSFSIASETSKFGFGLGFLNGGETLATATLVNIETGNETESSVTSGGGFNFWLGYLIPTYNNFDTHISLGYLVDSITAVNGRMKFDRYTLDAIPHYVFNNIRIGAGATYHINTTYLESGFGNDIEINFENTLGTVFMASIKIERVGIIEIRRTIMDYRASTVNGVSVDGKALESNSWGIFLSGYFN